MWNQVPADKVHLQFHFISDREHSLLPFGGRVGDRCIRKWLATCCENYTNRTKAICGQNVMMCQTVKYHSHITADCQQVKQVSNLSDLIENTTCSIRKTTQLICSVKTSQKTQRAWITETIQLMCYGERSTMYCKNHIEYANTQCGQNAHP